MKVGNSSRLGYYCADCVQSTSLWESVLGCKLALWRQMSIHSSTAVEEGGCAAENPVPEEELQVC